MKFEVVFVSLIALLLSACGGTVDKTNSNGRTTIDPTGVLVSADGKYASETGIAAAGDGRIFVVWSERDENKKHDIFVREYDASLAPKGDAVRVNPEPGTSRTWYGDAPSILVAPDGKIHVGWNRTYADGSPGNDLMLSTSTDGGKTFGEPLKINDDSEPASHGMHGMTLDAQGRVLISWLDERYLKKKEARAIRTGGPFLGLFHHTPTPVARQPESEEPDAELYFAVVADGKLTGPNRKIAGEICPCCRVSLATSPDRTVYVSYRKVFPGQLRHIAVSTSIDGGATFGDPVQVADDKWKLFACPVTGAAVRTVEGRLEIAWYSGGDRGEKGLYRASSGDKGKTFSAPDLVSKTMLKGSPEFVGDGLIFGDNEKIYLSTGSPRPINDGVTPAAVVSGSTIFSAFAAPNGDSSEIRLSRYSQPNGTAVASYSGK